MAAEWATTTLRDEADLLTGFPFKSDGYTEAPDAIRLLRGDNIVQASLRWDGVKRWPQESAGEYAAYRLAAGDVVLAMDRPWIEAGLKYAAIGARDLPCLLVQRTARLRGNQRLDTGFLRYLIGSKPFTQHVLAVQTGTTVPHISSRQILDFEFLLPPLPEQKRIAHILGTLDDKIEVNRRMNATLEGISRAIFKSWFVDFDPVRQKAAGKQPIGMDAQTAALFPDSFEDSEIGEVPKGWPAQPIGALASVDKGLSYKGSGLVDEGGVPMVNLGCFQGAGRFAAENIKGYAGDYASRHVVSAGDLVVANTDMTQKRLILGSPAIVPSHAAGPKILFTHHVFTLRFTAEASHLRRYVYFCLLRSDFRTVAEGYATGTTVLALPKEAILNYSICRPSEAVLERFMLLVGPSVSLCEANERQTASLAALRDTLLPKLLSGEIRVPEAEETVEEALA